MKRMKRSTVLPLILLIYLAGMAWISLKGVKSGETSYTTYFLTIAVTLALIVTLHFFLKRCEKLREEREKDMNERQN